MVPGAMTGAVGFEVSDDVGGTWLAVSCCESDRVLVVGAWEVTSPN